jgi:hypothetical protein
MQVQHEQEDKEEDYTGDSSRSAQPYVSCQPLATSAIAASADRPPLQIPATEGHDRCSDKKRTAPLIETYETHPMAKCQKNG